VVGSAGRKKDNVKNIKFFKILIYYSKNFKKFVRECANDMAGINFGDTIIQVFSILNQIISEVDSLKTKQTDLKELNKNLGMGRKNLVVQEQAPDEETLKRRAEREARALK